MLLFNTYGGKNPYVIMENVGFLRPELFKPCHTLILAYSQSQTLAIASGAQNKDVHLCHYVTH